MDDNTHTLNTIAVHNGKFHADDVFACAIMRLINPEIKIIRSRDQVELDSADIRADVCMRYNPENMDFDHHQKEPPIRENDIPYASAGLIWKHFGMKLVSSKEVLEYIDERIMQPIDASDNGIRICQSEVISPFTISRIILDFNPSWQDKDTNPDEAFESAVNFAIGILSRRIVVAEGIEKADNIIRSAIRDSKKINDNIIILEQMCPWKKIAIDESDAYYVVYPTSTGNYNVQAIPKDLESFENRKSFPTSWAGLEGMGFIEETGVEDGIFCHKNLFICGAKSKEGALKLANLAVEHVE
ncbi:MAG: MYG1 family protein [Nanoarchaeota archaeon]|nr:MYG1 family protein [Nanoarchaeota archaeon]